MIRKSVKRFSEKIMPQTKFGSEPDALDAEQNRGKRNQEAYSAKQGN
jgi:hypothetical protein